MRAMIANVEANCRGVNELMYEVRIGLGSEESCKDLWS